MKNLKNIVFVLGYPITSIGKGTFSANIAKAFLKKSSCHIIKFDGILNKDFSKLTEDEDIKASLIDDGIYGGYDFKTYKTICKNLIFSQSNIVIGADLITKFIENMNDSQKALRFIPHLSEFFIKELELRWITLHKPDNLVVEVGGVIGNLENRYVIHAINLLKNQYSNITLCLLTSMLYNQYDNELKSRIVQDAIQKSKELGMDVNYFLIRSYYEVSESLLLKIASITGINRNKLLVFRFVDEDKIYNEIENLNLTFLKSY